MILDSASIYNFVISLIDHIREGRFERSMAFIAGFSAIISGVEVTQGHYTGSFGQNIMYSPLVCCTLLFVTGIWCAFDPPIAGHYLLFFSALLILNGLTGFGFHIRGIARKPGGWNRNWVTNIVMGPPLFAPLLLCIIGLFGIIASQLAPEESMHALLSPVKLEILRKWLAASTALSAALNGFEALYSHYKSRFRFWAQWIPIILAPPLVVIGVCAIFFPDQTRIVLITFSALAMMAGITGMAFHLNGIRKRPGGVKHIFYNVLYGPPIFAPLLFAATGLLGLLTSQIGWSS